jgi:ABC-type glycerol-3-phosphate transport system permease component
LAHVREFWRHELFWPGVLIVVGLYFLLRNLGLLDWLRPDIVVPILIIALGVWLIARRART